MQGYRVAIRITGVAASPRGFAFAVMEGPRLLLDWGLHRTSSYNDAVRKLRALIRGTRPLFIACEVERNESRSARARSLNAALKCACAEYGIMILCVVRTHPDDAGCELGSIEIARAVASQFPILADKLPRDRQRFGEGPDERGAILFAAAAAIGGWNHFRRPRAQT